MQTTTSPTVDSAAVSAPGTGGRRSPAVAQGVAFLAPARLAESGGGGASGSRWRRTACSEGPACGRGAEPAQPEKAAFLSPSSFTTKVLLRTGKFLQPTLGKQPIKLTGREVKSMIQNRVFFRIHVT